MKNLIFIAAIEKNHIRIVDKLLSYKDIDLNQKTKQGDTPLHLGII